MGTSTMELFTAVVILSIAQVCYGQVVCEICGEGLVVTNLDEPVPLPGQNSSLTCEELQQRGHGGQISESKCAAATEFIFDVCGCSPAAGDPTSTPAQLQPPTLAPIPEIVPDTSPPTSDPKSPQPVDTVAALSKLPVLSPMDDTPTLGPGVNPPCSICGEGMRITLLDPIVSIHGFPFEPTCEEFEEAGFQGQIPASNCPFVPSLVGATCGCASGAAPVLSTPGDSPPTPPDQGDDTAICHVCGEARSQITIADATTDITGELLTCQELQTRGLAGALKRVECPFVPMLIRDPCGCSEGTIAPGPTTAPAPTYTVPPAIPSTTGSAILDEPAEPGLSCDASATIGSDQGDANEVQFFYEVLSSPPTVTSALESILRTTFEPALIAALFSELFSSVCSRRLAAAVRRRLNVIGLKAKPNDELLTTVECSMITETDGNKCTVVRGVLTLYAEDGSDITEQKQATLDRTRVSMSNGAFDNLDLRLVQVRYRSETLDESGTQDPAPGPAPASPSSVPAWACVLMGVVIVSMNILICRFCMRRRRQNKEAEEDYFGYGVDLYMYGAGCDYGSDASADYSGQYSGQYEEEMERARDSFSDELQQTGNFSNPHDMTPLVATDNGLMFQRLRNGR